MSFEVSPTSPDLLPFEPGSPNVDAAIDLSARVLHHLGLKPDEGLRKDYVQLASLGLNGVLYPRLSAKAQSFTQLIDGARNYGIKIFNTWGSKGHDGIVGYDPQAIDLEANGMCRGNLAVFSLESLTPHPLLHGVDRPFDDDAMQKFSRGDKPDMSQVEYLREIKSNFVKNYENNFIKALDVRDFLMLVMHQWQADMQNKTFVGDMDKVLLVNPAMDMTLNRALSLFTGRFNFLKDEIFLDGHDGSASPHTGFGLSVSPIS